MNNQDFIDAYKKDDKIISDYYKLRDSKGKLIDLTGTICPLRIDNRQLMSPTDNQTVTPHCAGYSAATLVESLLWKRSGKLKQLDSHQVYALAKQIDGEVQMDGTYLEAAMKAVLTLCKKDPEFSFLDEAKVGLFYNDQTDATIQAAKDLIHRYDFLQVGFNIDEGWYTCTQNNYVLRPHGRSLGGHAVNLCGYDEDGFYVMNQWSIDFGSKGFAIMPYDMFLKQFMYGAYLYNYKAI